MIVPSFLANRTVAVLGLGRSGLAAVEALAKGGARVLAWDDAQERREPLAGLKIPVTPIADWIWSEIAMLVLSPGIPLTHPRPHAAVQAAKAAGVPVMGDIELLGRAQPQARYVGITGTNGKSTTTALTACLLQAAGETVAVGGNLGAAALSLAPLDHTGLYVLELSSYQLDLVDRMRFDVSALLNITPDHLERHGGMDGYIAAKERIFQGPGAAIVGVDDEIAAALANRIDASATRRLIRISGHTPLDRGVYVQEGWLIDAIDGSACAVFDLNGLKALPGSHNAQNAAASYAICRALEAPVARALEGFSRFPGLPHRQEHVGQIGKVAFINDSKATNAAAAARALGCYEAIYWIAGGVPKADGIASLAGYFPRIRHAFLIGQAAESFAAALHGQTPVSRCDNLAKAVAAAFSAARADDLAQAVVLLSPACASFDQFADFEQRGDIFRRLVAGLIAECAA